jgi:hypothetical protein
VDAAVVAGDDGAFRLLRLAVEAAVGVDAQVDGDAGEPRAFAPYATASMRRGRSNSRWETRIWREDSGIRC